MHKQKKKKYIEVNVGAVVVVDDVVVFVVVFVGCRKLTICSVMELRRFHILRNLCVTDISAFHGGSISFHQHFSLSPSSLIPSSLFPSFFPSALFHHLLHVFFKTHQKFSFFRLHAHSDKMARAEDFQIIVR